MQAGGRGRSRHLKPPNPAACAGSLSSARIAHTAWPGIECSAHDMGAPDVRVPARRVAERHWGASQEGVIRFARPLIPVERGWLLVQTSERHRCHCHRLSCTTPAASTRNMSGPEQHHFCNEISCWVRGQVLSGRQSCRVLHVACCELHSLAPWMSP